jgi:FAD linked oxidases, C-terminal domain
MELVNTFPVSPTPCSSFPHPENFMHFIPGTGEHGVGIGKKEFLVEELGEGTVKLMKTIKRAIDPLGIMNPGKVCTIHCGPQCCRACYLIPQQLYPDDVVVSQP